MSNRAYLDSRVIFNDAAPKTPIYEFHMFDGYSSIVGELDIEDREMFQNYPEKLLKYVLEKELTFNETMKDFIDFLLFNKKYICVNGKEVYILDFETLIQNLKIEIYPLTNT